MLYRPIYYLIDDVEYIINFDFYGKLDFESLDWEC